MMMHLVVILKCRDHKCNFMPRIHFLMKPDWQLEVSTVCLRESTKRVQLSGNKSAVDCAFIV